MAETVYEEPKAPMHRGDTETRYAPSLSLLEQPTSEILEAIRKITSRREGVALFRAELEGKQRVGVLRLLETLLNDVAETFEEQKSRELSDPRSWVPRCSSYIAEIEGHRKEKRLLRRALRKNQEAALELMAPYVCFVEDALRKL